MNDPQAKQLKRLCEILGKTATEWGYPSALLIAEEGAQESFDGPEVSEILGSMPSLESSDPLECVCDKSALGTRINELAVVCGLGKGSLLLSNYPEQEKLACQVLAGLKTGHNPKPTKYRSSSIQKD